MPIQSTFQLLGRNLALVILCLFAVLAAPHAIAQSQIDETKIDPRLVEIVEIVKSRSIGTGSEPISRQSDNLTQDEIYIGLMDQMMTAAYSQKADVVLQATDKFMQAYNGDAAIDLSGIYTLYTNYGQILMFEATAAEAQVSIDDFTDVGNWFEQYMALSLSAHLHATARQRQSALQKAQVALSIIPTKPKLRHDIYVNFARARIVSLISQLHNLQGNSDLALSTSLDYLRLTKDAPDPKSEVDLINNLIYSYSLGRDHDAQLYLSEQLLEIEQSQTSSVPGLSEMRISEVMNSLGRFQKGLGYAERSLTVAANPIVLRVSRVNKSIALAGLGRLDESRETAKLADVNFASDHMLKTETRTGDLYLAFLIAQSEDHQYATQLFNRQLDIKAQKFLANNSRDTTAMLAELENSRERQAEREAATVSIEL